ncbi:hypothetical protein ILUMI_19927, partial [Ignelater luminosus]
MAFLRFAFANGGAEGGSRDYNVVGKDEFMQTYRDKNKFANCGGGHPASYKGCTRFLKKTTCEKKPEPATKSRCLSPMAYPPSSPPRALNSYSETFLHPRIKNPKLKVLLSSPDSFDKILCGHAYSRAVRAHILAHDCLASIVINGLKLTKEELSAVENVINYSDRSIILRAHEDAAFHAVTEKLKNTLHTIENGGPTSKLW